MAKNKGAIGAGLGLAAVAAAAAGAYYFYGKNGSQHRKNLRGWMVKARGEVMEKMENLSNITENIYYQTVNEVLAKYKRLKSVTPKELEALKKDLKSHWRSIKSEILSATQRSKPRARSR